MTPVRSEGVSAGLRPAPAEAEATATATATAKACIPWDGGEGTDGGGRCKYVHVSSVAPSMALTPPPSVPSPPPTISRDLSECHGLLLVGVDLGRHVDPRHAWMLFDQLSKYSISIGFDPSEAQMDQQTPDNCRRRGGVGLRGVSRMDAAAKPTRTYLRRPRNPTPPRPHGIPAVAVAVAVEIEVEVAGQRPALQQVQGAALPNHPQRRRISRLPPAQIVASHATPCQPHCASARLPNAPPPAMPMNMPVNSSALRRLRAGGTRP